MSRVITRLAEWCWAEYPQVITRLAKWCWVEYSKPSRGLLSDAEQISRVTTRLAEWCWAEYPKSTRGLPSDTEKYPEWRNFQVAQNSHYGFFFLHTFPLAIAFKLRFVLFHQFNAKISIFAAKKYSVWLLSMTLKTKGLAENEINKLTSECQKDIITLYIMHESYTPM